MPTDVPGSDARHLVGRADLIATIERALNGGTCVMLTGPDGIGKTAVLDAVADAAMRRGAFVLRLGCAETERWLPYAGLADLMTQIPRERPAPLPAPQRAALDAVCQRGGITDMDSEPGHAHPGHAATGGRHAHTELACRLGLRSILEWHARRTPVLLAIDDVQWLDQASAGVIYYAARRGTVGQHRDERIKIITAQPSRSHPARPICHPPLIELAVPPLAAHDLAELLEANGLPCRAANRLRAESGGNPYLALALGGAFDSRTAPAWLPSPLPERVAARLLERITALPAQARETLFLAALATRPTINLLRLAGRQDAEHEVNLAVSAGLAIVDGPAIRFTPAAVASVLAGQANATSSAHAHRVLAAACTDPVERARHRAMSSTRPDADVARSLVSAAETASKRGARGLVSDLYLLAADRTPPELHAERLDWLLAAAEAAVGQPKAELAAQAAQAVLASDAPPGHRVRARIVLIDLAGQSINDMDEAFAAALADAGNDPSLLAPLRLRAAWRSIIEGTPDRAELEARIAATLADQAADTTTAALARAVQAHLQRNAGNPAYAMTLARALAGPQPPMAGRLHLTPKYLSVRFACADDRLEEARADLLHLLAIAERGGGEELVEVLRSLADVSARTGRCWQALDFAARAVAVCEEAGLSPGPTWYTMALVELAGGTLARALAYAERGVRASEQEGDSVYLARNLHAAGAALLRSGEARRGVATLIRLRDLERRRGGTDPSVFRWHGDLAVGFVSVGELTEAMKVVARARKQAEELGRSPGVLACLDRATSLILAARGDSTAAVGLATSAALRFAQLGQPIERGHTLLVLGKIERRRRRFASARAAMLKACDIFHSIDAKPWLEQAKTALSTVENLTTDQTHRKQNNDRGAGASAATATLTATEARIASLVRQGASNREIAAQIYVSVKTVEANLTRIYRKLGIRSRTQLSLLLSEE